MTLFETDQPARASEPWNPAPWLVRLLSLWCGVVIGLAGMTLPFVAVAADRLGRLVWFGPVVGVVLVAVAVWRVVAGDVAACRVWRVAWDQLADGQHRYRFVRRLHSVESTGRGLVVALRPPPPLTADELAKLGHQIASSEGMRLESARVVGRARWKPAHVEFRFLR